MWGEDREEIIKYIPLQQGLRPCNINILSSGY